MGRTLKTEADNEEANHDDLINLLQDHDEKVGHNNTFSENYHSKGKGHMRVNKSMQKEESNYDKI